MTYKRIKNAMSITVLLMLMAVSNYAQADDVVWEKVINLTDFNIHPPTSASMAFSPDGTKIYAVGDDTTFILKTETGEILQKYPSKGAVIGFSPDGQFIYTDELYKLDANTFEPIKKFAYDGYHVVSTNQNCSVIVAGENLDSYDSHKVIIINPETMEKLRGVPDLFGPIHGIAVSPDGKSFAFSSYDGELMEPHIPHLTFWETETCEKIALLAEEETGTVIANLTFSPDGTMLAATIDKNVVIFDVETLKPIENIECITDIPMNSLTFSPDSKYLVYGTGYFSGNDTQIAQINPCEITYTYEYPIFSGAGVLVSPNSTYILSLGLSLKLLNAHWEGVGIKEQDNIEMIYPNPTNNSINLEIDNNMQYIIKITDISANLLYTEEIINQSLFNYNVEHLTPGIYFLQLITNENILTYKFMKE